MSAANLFAKPTGNTANLFATNPTNNIFGNSNNPVRPGTSTTTPWAPTSNNTNPFAGNTSGGMSTSYYNATPYGQTNRLNIGSMRAPKFEPTKITYSSTNANRTWNDKILPGSIVNANTTGNLSAVEMRIEDYYLIRTNNLDSVQRTALEAAIRSKNYNPSLNNPPAPPLPVTANSVYEPTSSNFKTNTSTYQTQYGQTAGYGQQQQSANIFGQTSTSNNPFSNPNSNNSNPFSNNTTTNAMRNSTAFNMFNHQPTQPINNPFAQNTTPGNNTHIFSQQPTNMQQSTYVNPFAQANNPIQQSQVTNNLFTNNQPNSNIFTSNNQQQQNNLFANQTQSNNLFANTGNNNPNLFANNNSNNLFANNTSNIFANNGQQMGYSTPNLFQNAMQQSQAGNNVFSNVFQPQPAYNARIPGCQDLLSNCNLGMKPIFSTTPYYEQLQAQQNSHNQRNNSLNQSTVPYNSSYNPMSQSSCPPMLDPEKLVRSILSSTYSQLGVPLPPNFQNPAPKLATAPYNRDRNTNVYSAKPLIYNDYDDDYVPEKRRPKVIFIRQDKDNYEESVPLFHELDSVSNIRPEDLRKGINKERRKSTSEHIPEERFIHGSSQQLEVEVAIHERSKPDQYITLTVVNNPDIDKLELIRDKLLAEGVMRDKDELTIRNYKINVRGKQVIECRIDKRSFTIDLPEGYSCSHPNSLTNKISGLVIWNQHGSVRWEDEVDIEGLDFKNLVFLRENEVEFYPGRSPPPLGREINKPCVVTFNRCQVADIVRQKYPNHADWKAICEKRLRNACQRNQAEFISYDEASGKWSFRLARLPVE